MATPRWIVEEQRWRLDTRINGKRKQFSSIIPGKAGERAVNKAAKHARDGQADRSTWRLQKCWDEYIANLKLVSTYENLHQRESLGKKYILPELKHRKAGSILRGDWQDVINKAYGKTDLSKKSLQNLRSTIVNFCKYALDHGMVEYIPMSPSLTIPGDASVIGKEILSPTQVKALWTAAEQWYLYVWQMILVMGLRPGEIFGIKLADICGTTITIRRAINWRGHETKGKNKNATRRKDEMRVFELPLIALEIIAKQRAMLSKAGIISPFLFPRQQGQRSAQQQSSDAFREMFPGRTPYCLRHTHYSATRKAMPEAWSKMWLGHTENMDTDGTYGHTVPEEISGAAKKIEEVFRAMLA